MGGLLDKANAAKDTEPTEEPAPVRVDTTASAARAATTSTKGPTPDGADNAMKVSLAGWVIILVGAILSLQGGPGALLWSPSSWSQGLVPSYRENV
jgi:hypothetical protein